MSKNVLVTGGTGYIGSHTCVELIKAGYTPIIVDNLCNSKVEVLNRIYQITGVLPHFYMVDVRNEKELEKVFDKYDFEYVIHFAGLKAVGESTEKPDLYYDNNIGSTKALLNVMNKYNVKKIVFSSSATVYGDPKKVPLYESDELGKPTNPYAETKLKCEQLLIEYQKEHPDVAVVLLRYFNPVGAHPSGLMGEDPRGIPNNLMPYVSQVASGKLKQLSIFGDDYKTKDGTGVRDYIHVVDLARGHIFAFKKLDEKPDVYIYNLGTGKGTSVIELVHAFEKANNLVINKKVVSRRPGDVAECFANVDKAKKELGFTANLTIEDAARDSWNWQKNNPLGYDTRHIKTKKEKVSFTNKLGEELFGYSWTVESPKANVIIVTGMEEYAERYDEFANFLNEHGYDVFCIDHYGQGLNVSNVDELGIVPPSFFSKSVKNIDQLVSKCRPSCLPTYIFAHSMGSFMLQDYIQRFTQHVNKVVICGTNGPSNKLTYSFGYFLAKLLVRKKNRDQKAKLFSHLAFGAFNKKIKNPNFAFDWLSNNVENVERYVQSPYCGYGSTNGFYLELLKGNNRLFKKKFIKKIRPDMSIFIVSGQDDPAGSFGKGPKSLYRMYRRNGVSDVHLKLYANMRHEILNENGHEAVFQDILRFFESKHRKVDLSIK